MISDSSSSQNKTYYFYLILINYVYILYVQHLSPKPAQIILFQHIISTLNDRVNDFFI